MHRHWQPAGPVFEHPQKGARKWENTLVFGGENDGENIPAPWSIWEWEHLGKYRKIMIK